MSITPDTVGAVIPMLRERHRRTKEGDLFAPATAVRKMRVMVDAELAARPDRSGPVTPTAVLAGFLHHSQIELWRYRVGGPSPDEAKWVERWGRTLPMHWPLVSEMSGEPARHVSYSVEWADNERIMRGAIFGRAVAVAERDTRSTAYDHLPPSAAAAQRRLDAVAAETASTIQADLFISGREYLNEVTWSLGRGVTLCAPREGLALISLYLRHQGEFFDAIPPTLGFSSRYDKDSFFLIGARELLPQSWRWLAASRPRREMTDETDLLNLQAGVVQRLSQALQARDSLMWALNSTRASHEDVHLGLDSCLLFLMASLDTAARFTHGALGLPGEQQKAGWQKPDWVKNAGKLAPDLSAILKDGTTHAAALTLLKTLRNTIHQAGMSQGVHQRVGQREQIVVGLPKADAKKLASAVKILGGAEKWGWTDLGEHGMHADPRLLVEFLLPAIVKLLNALMGATPVERLLGGGTLLPEDGRPPTGTGSQDLFNDFARNSIRWQLGL